VEQKIPGGLSAEDWTLLQQVSDLIRGAIPPGSNSPPAKVFGVIETALPYADILRDRSSLN
jgi:hypothetical protein